MLVGEIVGPRGKVTGIDISPKMIEVARAAAQARGVANVEFQVMDAEELSFKTATFDAVICKWSLEQFTDAHKALKEALRVLKPGGVLAAMVVGRAERSKFLALGPLEIFRIDPALVTAEPGAPSTFDLGGEGSLEAAFNAAGFIHVQTQNQTLMITCADGASYWELIWNGNGFMKHKLEQAGPAVTQRAKIATIATASSFLGANGIRLPFEVVVGVGEKPKKPKDVTPGTARLKSLDELAQGSTVREIDAGYGAELVGQPGVVFIDVRSANEVANGKIFSAHHVPRSVLETQIGKLIDLASTQQIIVYSGTNRRARLAAATLVGMGYEGVSVLDGGFQRWQGATER